MAAAVPGGAEVSDVAGAQHPSVRTAQHRTLLVLIGTQAAAGVGVAAGIAVSNLVAAELSGSDVIGGAASTAMLIGAALASYTMGRVAARSGRRPELTLGYTLGGIGALGAALAVTLGSWPVLLVAMVPFGSAIAAGLAARFAATDLADPRRVARELAMVLWAVTVGVIVGPNLAEPAQQWAGALGLVPATGPYLLCAAAFGLAVAGTVIGLRPDPLVLARELETADDQDGHGLATPPWQALRRRPPHSWPLPESRSAT